MKMYPSTISSRRWCPTPEQVMILEEMYIGGIRTPKAVQIEAITAHLSHYGKIEGKNVFYWFQNHKARDRQKLRKKLMMSKQIHHQHQQLKYQNQQSPQFFYYIPDPVEVPTQAGIMNALPHSISSRKVDLLTPDQQSVDVDKTIAKMDDHDWPVVLDVAPTKNKPLETLELFPTTPTDHGLKNECTTDYKPNHPVNL